VKVDADGALESYREYGQSVIIDMFADQVDAPGG
jgi:hypothetical protein